MVITVIKATPDQVEKQWDNLTPRQKELVNFARTVGKNLEVEVLCILNSNLFVGLGVER